MNLSVTMTRKETLFGWTYMALSILFLPILIGLIGSLLPIPLSESQANILYFFLNFIFVVVIFHRFLAASFRTAFRNPWRCLRFAALGLLLYWVATVLLSLLINRFYPAFANVNDAAIAQMSQENYTLIAFCTVFLVPVAEETFHRGLVFRMLHSRSRWLAYLISTVLFSMIHIVGYIGFFDFTTLLICFIQYLPAGVALAFSYEKADTIIAPILIHIAVNQYGMSAMR